MIAVHILVFLFLFTYIFYNNAYKSSENSQISIIIYVAMPSQANSLLFFGVRAKIAILQYKHYGFPPFTYSTGTNPLYD